METYSYDRRRFAFKKASNEDNQELIEDTREQAEKYLKRANGFPETLLELSKILETPRIAEESRRAAQRITDVKAILLIAKSTYDDIGDMDNAFIELSKELAAKGNSGVEEISQRLIEGRLPRLNKLRALKEEAQKIMDRLSNEDPISWDGGLWLGSKVVLHKELRKKAPKDSDIMDWNLVEGLDNAVDSFSTDTLKEYVLEDIETLEGGAK